MRKRRQLDEAARSQWRERILLLKILRAARGWTRLQLAKAAGLALLRVAVRERGYVYLDQREFDQLVAALGFRPAAVDAARRFLALLEQERSSSSCERR
jgi:transcriptional regulator with XRE-family HTH domain